jgi:hypothetical protein
MRPFLMAGVMLLGAAGSAFAGSLPSTIERCLGLRPNQDLPAVIERAYGLRPNEPLPSAVERDILRQCHYGYRHAVVTDGIAGHALATATATSLTDPVPTHPASGGNT